MIHSNGITPNRTILEKIPSNPSLEIQKTSNNVAIEETNTQQHHKENNQEADTHLNEKKMLQAIDEFNKKAESYNRRLEYSVHERTKRIMVKVIDMQTEEVIRELPEEKMMDMMADFCEASGILIDKKV